MPRVVIELDSTDYMYIKNGCFVPIKIDNHIYNAIRGGIVLPEGHGDLIDRSKLAYYRCPNNVNDCPTSYDFTCNSCDYGIIHKFQVDRADAIIPADKEKE